VPSRLQLLVVFWSTGAAAICLMQALIAGDPLTLVPALVLSLAACLGATAAQWVPAYQRVTAAMGARIGPASGTASKST
jgi:hypothetical protein